MFEDAEAAQKANALSFSFDAIRLGLNQAGSINMRFLDKFNALLHGVLRATLNDRDLKDIVINMGDKDAAPIAREVSEGTCLQYIGNITFTPAVGSIECAQAWGMPYYIHGNAFKTTSSSMVFPAWSVPLVAENLATFSVQKKVVYFNWPSDIPHPAHAEQQLSGDHEVLNFCQVRVANGDDDSLMIYWPIEVPVLVPKKEYIGRTDVAITRGSALPGVITKGKRTSKGGGALPDGCSSSTAEVCLGMAGVRAQKDRANLTGVSDVLKRQGSLTDDRLLKKAKNESDKRGRHLLK